MNKYILKDSSKASRCPLAWTHLRGVYNESRVMLVIDSQLHPPPVTFLDNNAKSFDEWRSLARLPYLPSQINGLS